MKTDIGAGPVKLEIDGARLQKIWARVQKDASLLLVFLLLIFLVYIFNRGVGFGVDQGSTSRVSYHAMPVAIAALYHGLPHDYTSRKSFALTFQDENMSIQERIDFGRTAYVDPKWEKYYWVADDRGMADYVIAAFKIFGPNEISLYKFYFLLLLVSVGAFVWAHYRSPAMLALAVFTIAGVGVFQPILPLVDEQAFLQMANAEKRGSPVGLFEPRILDILTMLSVLHISLFPWRTTRLSLSVIAALVVQVLIFLFCYHARSSLGWQLLAMFVLAGVAIALRGYCSGKKCCYPVPGSWGITILPVIFLLGGLAGLNAYKHVAYDPLYFKEMGSRTFWHNALMGLSSSGRLNQKYKLAVDDRMVIDAVLHFETVDRKRQLPPDWNTDFILRSLGGGAQFDWKTYETYARDFYFHILSQNKTRVLVLYAVKKPWDSIKTILRNVMNQRDARINKIRESQGLFFNPFDTPLFLFVLIATALAFGGLLRCWDIWGATILIGVASFIPSVAFYPAVLTQGGMFVAFCILLYLLIPVALNLITRRYVMDPVS